jgi:hypothetical protein
MPCLCTFLVQPLVAVATSARPHGLSRVEEPEHAGTAELLRERREERIRHAEEHGHDVDAVRAEQLGPRLRVAEALGDALQARPLRVRGRRDSTHHPERGQRHEERGDVDPEHGWKPERGDEHAPDRGAADEADLEPERVERARRGQLVPLDQSRRERVERRAQEAAHPRGERLGDEQHPDLRRGDDRVHEQRRRAEREAELGDSHHLPAVDGVREGTADDGREQERHERDEREEADDCRRAGQLVGLVRDGDEGHL